MGVVIKAVRRLFNSRGEMLHAKERDETLFNAAREFNQAIDDFENREKQRIAKNNKKHDEGRVQQIEQNIRKIDTVEKVNSPTHLAKEILTGRKECVCGGSNKNCRFCDGKGWFDSSTRVRRTP